MGRPQLPNITKVEEVLDLFLYPQKYQRYMEELKAVFTETKLALGDLHTKEQADSYLSQAIRDSDIAIQDRTSAHATLIEAQEYAKTVKTEHEQLRTQLESDRADLVKRQHDLSVAESQFEATKVPYAAVVQEYDALRIKLDQGKSELKALLADIDEAKKAFEMFRTIVQR